MTARRLSSTGLALLLALAPEPGSAEPSIWARARHPILESRRKLAAEIEEALAKYVQALRESGDIVAALHLRDARRRIESADPALVDREVLFRYAEVLSLLGVHEEAIAVSNRLLAMDPPPAMAAEVYPRLALAYAHTGDSRREIAAYDEALKLEPHAEERSRLLANRAEAFMTIGDLTAALPGYRDALAILSQHDLAGSSVTVLWGLAVATDRSGDLDEALRTIRLARSYDPLDRHINGPGWFYVLEWDRYWYEALGHWSAARYTEQAAVRAEAYARAVDAWETYVASAPPTDPWAALGRARLAQCQKERERRTAMPSSRRSPGAPGAPASKSPRKANR